MSYDLFSLTFIPRQGDRTIIDLVDPKGVSYYTKRRVQTAEYKIEVYDTLSESLLASVSSPSATSKHKTLQLHNPDSVVELKSTGVLSFKWNFKWEDHEFEWKREECYMLRKPDPAVIVAQTKEPPGKLQTRNVQILDYNINRFDINDRKGLEIVILTALLTFSDLNEAAHSPTPPASAPAAVPAPLPSSTASPNVLSAIGNTPTAAPDDNMQAPAVPPKPAPRIGVERVTEMHTLRNALGEGDANEVSVWEECDVVDYAQYAERLLNDEAMLFISIRSASQAQVPKVLKVVEETKRLRHKAGIADEEIHQYVIYDTEKPKGPKRINLNDPDPKKGKIDADKYAPPTSLTVHLSKIDMPELQPKPTTVTQRRASDVTTSIHQRRASELTTRAPSPRYTETSSRPAARSPSPPPPSYPVYRPSSSLGTAPVRSPPPPPPSYPMYRSSSSLGQTPPVRSPSPPQALKPSLPGVLPPMPVAVRELTDKERRQAEKERQRLEKEREKAAKEREKFEKKKGRRVSSAYPPPSTNMLTKPPSFPSPSPHHTPAHLVHPYQPSPSPSQLNNPGIYSAPPPHAPSPRPRPVSTAFNPTSGEMPQSAYQPIYLSPTTNGDSRPSSVYGSRDNMGPVSGLMHMWSRD